MELFRFNYKLWRSVSSVQSSTDWLESIWNPFLISKMFIPEPSEKSIGAYEPIKSDTTKDEINETDSVWDHFSLSSENFRIWLIEKRSYDDEPVIFERFWAPPTWFVSAWLGMNGPEPTKFWTFWTNSDRSYLSVDPWLDIVSLLMNPSK